MNFSKSRFPQWANEIIELFAGGPNSIKGYSLEFERLMEKLVQPNVWQGEGAYQNFLNFDNAHTALINFTNQLGNSFEEEMRRTAEAIAAIEESNLARNSSEIKTAAQEIHYDNIQKNSETIKAQENGEITYNYYVIEEISQELKAIKTNSAELETPILAKMDELNNGSGMFDGSVAEEVKMSLKKVFTENMNEVLNALNICIENIEQAAIKAKDWDASRGGSANYASDPTMGSNNPGSQTGPGFGN